MNYKNNAQWLQWTMNKDNNDNEQWLQWEWTMTTMQGINFLPTSRKVLPTFRTFRPDGVQMVIHFAHFQVQARLAARHAFTMPMHAVKFLYTATFYSGLKVATQWHTIVIVHCYLDHCALSFIQGMNLSFFC